MPKEYSVNHIQILRLASFADLRYLLTFSGGENSRVLTTLWKGVREHRRGGSTSVRPATSTTQLISLICGQRKRRQGGTRPKIGSQVSRRVSRKERYLHRSRKKGDTKCRKILQGKILQGATALTSWRALWLRAQSAGVGR